ncbi:hypothetical protein [Pararobbsia alpina]|uniref:hypothetical protein n=1 Tax=Pararobbsia alpina TaxID=621374 RepID=UPI0039A42642
MADRSFAKAHDLGATCGALAATCVYFIDTIMTIAELSMRRLPSFFTASAGT